MQRPSQEVCTQGIWPPHTPILPQNSRFPPGLARPYLEAAPDGLFHQRPCWQPGPVVEIQALQELAAHQLHGPPEPCLGTRGSASPRQGCPGGPQGLSPPRCPGRGRSSGGSGAPPGRSGWCSGRSAAPPPPARSRCPWHRSPPQSSRTAGDSGDSDGGQGHSSKGTVEGGQGKQWGQRGR